MTEQVQVLEKRVSQLERDVSLLKSQAAPGSEQLWWQRIAGRFEHDQAFDEIVRLGREYRESLRSEEER